MPGSNGGVKRRDLLLSGSSLLAASVLPAVSPVSTAQAQPTTGQRPNILVIMGDDIGYRNISAQALMAQHLESLSNSRRARSPAASRSSRP